jgi:hypothetical protein
MRRIHPFEGENSLGTWWRGREQGGRDEEIQKQNFHARRITLPDDLADEKCALEEMIEEITSSLNMA